MMTVDQPSTGMFICFLSLYQGTPEEVNLQVTQGSEDVTKNCFGTVLSSVKQHEGYMIAVSNEVVKNTGGIYSRLWCVWEVFCAHEQGVRLIIHPLTGSLPHLFGSDISRRSSFDPSLARCGKPGSKRTDDENSIRDFVTQHDAWTEIRKVILKSSRFTNEAGRLAIFKCKLQGRGIKLLLSSAFPDPSLEMLDIRNNPLGDDSVKLIASLLETNDSLKDVHLRMCGISDVGAQALADALRQNKTVTKLELGENDIGDAGAEAIADAMRKNSTVSYLGLNNNKIGDTGAEAIVDALCQNETDMTLWMQGNSIGEAGKTALVNVRREKRRMGKSMVLHL
eukprot:NODE_10563_length_1343_cov_4.047697.p1 GENE.NODE_10563_length_1343_cov_4.047697~~NODE_10563_length_1343_cov_4.047697.p1  ORF type:complete len:338 (+),score=61.24 NODE_10563_length_1343_cov_4.047697:220-1233(+)